MSIALIDLTKRFGKTLVVNRVSLEVQDGELFVLLGGSGSGKSTILRMIAGLWPPDAGTIRLNGRDVTSLQPQLRGTGFVFQNYSIFRHMTAAENVEFGLRIRRISGSERRRRCEELLDLVGLAGLGARYADQLSGGQQQRVALARALAYRPSVLLLDEPFGALDVKIRAQLRSNLKEIQRRLRLTAILVTHDQDEAFELADRIGVIDRGSLIEVGPPEELYHRPRTEFVASFIGGSNVLVGRVEGGHIQLGSLRLPPPQTSSFPAEGSRVRLLCRPEAVLLQSEPFPVGGEVAVLGQGSVTERVFAGSLQRFRLGIESLREKRSLAPQPDFGKRTIQIEAVCTNAVESSHKFVPGEKLWIGFKNYHLLEAGGLKLLICSEDSGDGDEVVDFGCQLTLEVGGSATLLSVVESSEKLARARERLQNQGRHWLDRLPRLETRVRRGSSIHEILLEVQEGHYEVVIVGRHRKSLQAKLATFGPTVRQLLERIGVPVLIVQKARPGLNRILICSAVGEPGKADVRIGGRLASRAGALATVLHVGSRQQTSEQRKRVEEHLHRALITLDAFGVKGESKVGEEPSLASILREAEAGDYDLIVIGAPTPRTTRRLRWHDLAAQIVNATSRPVLVVPMVE